MEIFKQKRKFKVSYLLSKKIAGEVFKTKTVGQEKIIHADTPKQAREIIRGLHGYSASRIIVEEIKK